MFSYKLKVDDERHRKQEFAVGLACVLRGNVEAFPNEEAFSACEVDQLASGFVYGKHDEVVSKFIRLQYLKDSCFKGSMAIAIPHCMSRNSAIYREPVLKADVNGTWIYVPAEEVHFDEYKEGKFVQARFDDTMPNFACVVTRYKKEEMHAPLRGVARVCPAVDQRICIKIDPGTFHDKTEIRFHMQIQPVDSQTVKEVHANLQPQGYGLITSSNIVNVSWKDTRFRKPVTVCLPIPPNQLKAKKHIHKSSVKTSAAAASENAQPATKTISKTPAVAKNTNKWYMGIFGEDESDLFHFMYYDEGSDVWSPNADVRVQETQKDLLQFQIPCAYSRFAVLRTRTFITPPDAKVIFNAVEQQLKRRTVRFVLFQGVIDHGQTSLFCVLSSRFDELYEELANEGWRYFGEKGPPTSKDVSIEEGQQLEIQLRGNIKFDDKKYAARRRDITTRFFLNSQLLTQVEFFVTVQDLHLQKAYEFYKGLCLVARSKPMVVRPSAVAGSGFGSRSMHGSVILTESLPLCELTLQLTKQSNKKTHLPLRPQMVLRFMGPKNKEALEFLSQKLGKEWEPLGLHLGLPKGRLQAIKMRNKLHPENCKEDMLITWAKTQTNSGSRLTKLYRALMTSGRIDLAYKLEDIYSDEGSRRQSVSQPGGTVSSSSNQDEKQKLAP